MSASRSSLRCELLEDLEALAELRPAWDALCDACPTATPFQRPQWLLPWTAAFEPDRPWILVVRDEDRLLGLAPLCLHDDRTLGLLGAGPSDYLDLTIAAGFEQPVVAAMLETLATVCERWDACELDQLRPWASPLLRTPLPAGWSTPILSRGVCPSLSLPSRVAELDRHVPRRHLQRFEQYRRKAARLGPLRLERATPRTCPRLLDRMIELHEARWRERTGRGCLADPEVSAVHHQIAAAFAARDALALYALELDGRTIATLYGFEQRGCLYFYLAGFDPAAASLSPGALILGMVIEESIRRGLDRLDFLRGDEAYKYWWGAEDRPTVRVRLDSIR